MTERPQLIFFTELGGGAHLRAALESPGVLDWLAACGAGVALALAELGDDEAEAARLLASRGVPAVAWLCLPQEESFALNLANYPRVADRYRATRAWAAERGLTFDAVGLSVEPPAAEGDWSPWQVARAVARGAWLARENALFPAARDAYAELVALIHHDGYEVHAYQLPIIADDRRIGTTLVQRAADILDLPADVDVLMCGSDVPIGWLDGDLGGALVASYGPAADAIGVGAADPGEPGEGALPWPALRRDLLLAARHTDTIYVATLEHCARAGLLPQIAALDWGAPARPALGRRLLVEAARLALLALLLAGRYGRAAVAWAGWALALALWMRQRRRQARRSRT